MSERDLAAAIHAELHTDEALDHAMADWYAHPELPLRTRLGVVLDAVTASALDRVLARRQSEAARTGPSKEALDVAETLVNHQWGVSVYRLALALDRFRADGLEAARTGPGGTP